MSALSLAHETRLGLGSWRIGKLAVAEVPGRVIPRNPESERAVFDGERLFEQIGCAACHIPKLALDKKGWIYSEPNP